MRPCQQGCPNHREGCHKSCPDWKAFQARQKAQRQRKKDYLSYYNEVCSTMIRQFKSLSVRRPMMG